MAKCRTLLFPALAALLIAAICPGRQSKLMLHH
jgi:hypothetical protein